MFLNETILNRLMKQAYKSGLAVARTEEDWIYISGNYWEVNIKKDFIPKKTMGNLISLIGELPGKGERIRASKDGNKIEVGMTMKVCEEPQSGERRLTKTNVLLIGEKGVEQGILQDGSTGEIYIINNAFIKIVDNSPVDQDKGETLAEEPVLQPKRRAVLWKNNVCKLRAWLRTDGQNRKILEQLEGLDLTPEVPE